MLETRRAVVVTSIALTLIAAPPRFIDLGGLSFYADEETSAFAARSLAEGDGARMPSGMSYRRALPFTWLNAAALKVFGEEGEMPYRVAAAVFGTLTVPLLFIVGRALVGGPPALVAATLLALSEWHLVFSRQSRMYAPFLFFFIAACYAIWKWAEKGRYTDLLMAALLFALAVSLHALGLLALIFVVIPIGFAGWARVSPSKLLAFGVIAAVSASAFDKYFVAAPYRAWIRPEDPAVTTATLSSWLPAPLTALPPWAGILAAAGAGLGFWAAALAAPADRLPGESFRTAARYAVAAIATALAFVGQLYGSALAILVFLLLYPGDRSDLVKRVWLPLTLAAIVAFVWTVASVIQAGPIGGLKLVSAFPFPYPAFLVEQFPGVVLLFTGVCIWFALRTHRSEEAGVRACLLAVILPIAAVGAVSEWGGTRYLFPAYPFLLLATSIGLVAALAAVGRRWGRWGERGATGFAIAIVASGVLGAHGIRQTAHVVRLKHGEPVNQLIHMVPFRPDHERPGEFVRQVRASDDIVIAEDPLQQRWYAGPVDFWLRSYADSRRFLHKAPDGRLRDIYVNSALLKDKAALDSVVGREGGRVWLITSGETYARRSYYLSPEQQRWLDSLESTRHPVFTGRDGITSVYCLNCPTDKRE